MDDNQLELTKDYIREIGPDGYIATLDDVLDAQEESRETNGPSPPGHPKGESGDPPMTPYEHGPPPQEYNPPEWLPAILSDPMKSSLAKILSEMDEDKVRKAWEFVRDQRLISELQEKIIELQQRKGA